MEAPFFLVRKSMSGFEDCSYALDLYPGYRRMAERKCPAPKNDWAACCICTQRSLFACYCCKDVVSKWGVGIDKCGAIKEDGEKRTCADLIRGL
eukprot:GFUD01092330.1.p2 GENE.GFUD01092330.1~~GFUD01092330.1.p2  ORF type:complete len:102 (-),score=26.06 GFUD01092330.1:94-375(-)